MKDWRKIATGALGGILVIVMLCILAANVSGAREAKKQKRLAEIEVELAEVYEALEKNDKSLKTWERNLDAATTKSSELRALEYRQKAKDTGERLTKRMKELWSESLDLKGE